MRKKHLLFTLLSAYLLLFAHSVIPHHHHENIQQAESHHHAEHTDHHHDQKPSEGHGHTPHFVHSPEFGNYILPAFFKLTNLPHFYIDLFFFTPISFNYNFQLYVADVDWLPDISPPYKSYFPLSYSLRGPPPFFF